MGNFVGNNKGVLFGTFVLKKKKFFQVIGNILVFKSTLTAANLHLNVLSIEFLKPEGISYLFILSWFFSK